MEVADETVNDDWRQNAGLYERLVIGDTSAIIPLIKANVGLVITIVDGLLESDSYCGFDKERDDLVGVGNLAMVEAVNRLTESKVAVENVGAYLGAAIERAAVKYCDECGGIGPSHATKKRARSAGIKRSDPREKITDPRKMEHRVRRRVPAGDAADLRELILSCCCDDLDREIVTRREQGYLDAEIAVAVGSSQQTVQRRREALESRFEPVYRQLLA